jgi:hypothetical protein
MAWQDVIDEILEKLGKGKSLTPQEMQYLQRELDQEQELHVEKQPKRVWPGWTGNGIQRAIIVLRKAKEQDGN